MLASITDVCVTATCCCYRLLRRVLLRRRSQSTQLGGQRVTSPPPIVTFHPAGRCPDAPDCDPPAPCIAAACSGECSPPLGKRGKVWQPAGHLADSHRGQSSAGWRISPSSPSGQPGARVRQLRRCGRPPRPGPADVTLRSSRSSCEARCISTRWW